MEKVALIQLNTNLLKLRIVDVLPSGHNIISDELSENINFYEDAKDNFLKPIRINEALAVLKMFKSLCDVNSVNKVIAVASHNFKSFKNHRSFLEEVYNITNFKFKILGTDEELQSLYIGVVNSVDVPKALIIDIEANNINFVYYNRRNVLNADILPIGTINICQLFENGNIKPQDTANNIVNYIKNELKTFDWLKNIDPEFKFVGTGSAFVNMAKLSRKLKKYPLDIDHNYVIDSQGIEAVYDLVKPLELDKNKKIKGIANESANLVVSGICIAKAITDYLNVQELTISAKSILEGLLLGYAMPITNEKPISDLLGNSLDQIVEFYDKPEANAKQVGELALILFRQLKVLHKLSRGYLKILRIASIMHDCGKRIQYFNNTKNGFNIILNSDIDGVSHRELVLASFVCASQESNDFSLSDWVKYKDLLEEEDLIAVKKLAIIVKIAKALDRTHRSVVVDVSCDVLGDSVIMKTIITADAQVEIKEALKANVDFKRAYGKNLEVL